MSLTLVIARHGATAWNEAGRYQGRADLPLSAAGEAEADALAERLAALALARVVASPLQRAAETARRIALPHAAPVHCDPALAEIDYGAWEGLTQPEVKLRWPDLLRQWKRHPDTVRLPGGECLGQARDRLRGLLDRLPALVHAGATVALVTHQTIVRLAVLEAAGRPAAALREVPAATATPYFFLLEQGRLHLLGTDRPAAGGQGFGAGALPSPRPLAIPAA